MRLSPFEISGGRWAGRRQDGYGVHPCVLLYRNHISSWSIYSTSKVVMWTSIDCIMVLVYSTFLALPIIDNHQVPHSYMPFLADLLQCMSTLNHWAIHVWFAKPNSFAKLKLNIICLTNRVNNSTNKKGCNLNCSPICVSAGVTQVIYIYIYIYTYRERDVYVFIYIYIHMMCYSIVIIIIINITINSIVAIML